MLTNLIFTILIACWLIYGICSWRYIDYLQKRLKSVSFVMPDIIEIVDTIAKAHKLLRKNSVEFCALDAQMPETNNKYCILLFNKNEPLHTILTLYTEVLKNKLPNEELLKMLMELKSIRHNFVCKKGEMSIVPALVDITSTLINSKINVEGV